MNKLLFAILLFVSISCNCQNFFWSHTGDSNAPCTEGYGLLYNWYAATDARKITSSDDWVVPTLTQWRTLADYLGAGGLYTSNTVGGKLKESGFTYWDSPNTGATNDVFFNARGIGYRAYDTGVFSQINLICYYKTTTTAAVGHRVARLRNVDEILYVSSSAGNQDKEGDGIRLLYTGAGTPTTYTGNDGKVYRIILIGSQYWLADNLQETKFRNGDIIPFHGIDNTSNFTNAEWAALTTAGCAAYNNDVANVGCDFSFPTE